MALSSSVVVSTLLLGAVALYVLNRRARQLREQEHYDMQNLECPVRPLNPSFYPVMLYAFLFLLSLLSLGCSSFGGWPADAALSVPRRIVVVSSSNMTFTAPPYPSYCCRLARYSTASPTPIGSGETRKRQGTIGRVQRHGTNGPSAWASLRIIRP